MTARNEITGDLLKSKLSNENFENNFDRIFRKDKVGGTSATTDKPVEPTQQDLFDEDRIDTIGANGNEGLHYDSDENV
jgi:hypothetical protein